MLCRRPLWDATIQVWTGATNHLERGCGVSLKSRPKQILGAGDRSHCQLRPLESCSRSCYVAVCPTRGARKLSGARTRVFVWSPTFISRTAASKRRRRRKSGERLQNKPTHPYMTALLRCCTARRWRETQGALRSGALEQHQENHKHRRREERRTWQRTTMASCPVGPGARVEIHRCFRRRNTRILPQRAGRWRRSMSCQCSPAMRSNGSSHRNRGRPHRRRAHRTKRPLARNLKTPKSVAMRHLSPET